MTQIEIRASEEFCTIFSDFFRLYDEDLDVQCVHIQDTEGGECVFDGRARAFTFPVYLGAFQDFIEDVLQQKENPPVLSFGSAFLSVHDALFTKADGKIANLTEKECAVLVYLHRRKGEPVSRDELLHAVWDYAEGVETHTLETHIYRLRQKIETDPSTPVVLLTADDGGYRVE